jgi:polysaccharide deacetylase family protein (PEP-CTERM system associated)
MELKPIHGILTLDVEDWDHANFSQLEYKRERISLSVRQQKYLMDSNVDLWMRTLEEFGAKSTCFVLGEFARRFPQSIRRLAEAGHEIASHGATHDLVYKMSQTQFREFLKKSLGPLGDLTGKVPLGFRAPCWSVDERTPWLCEELEAQKIYYDASLLPIQSPLKWKRSPLRPFWEGKVFRIPASTLNLGPVRVPLANGAFFRLLPLHIIRYGFRRAALRHQPLMIVLHPREIDPLHPRLPLWGWEKMIHYSNLNQTLPKLRKLLAEIRWTNIDEYYRDEFEKMKGPER